MYPYRCMCVYINFVDSHIGIMCIYIYIYVYGPTVRILDSCLHACKFGCSLCMPPTSQSLQNRQGTWLSFESEDCDRRRWSICKQQSMLDIYICRNVMYICMHPYVMCAYTYICVYIYMSRHMYISIHICMYISICIYIHKFT